MEELKQFHLGSISLHDALKTLIDMSLKFGFKLLICIIIYVIGKKIIKYLNSLFLKILKRREAEPSIESFLKSLVNITLNIILLLIIINILGINSTSFVAILASAGVAIGMALSGTLQNFAGGVMILLFKPYKVGDYIEAQNQGGIVKEIQIFNTVLTTPDNRTIFVPNGGLSTGIIMNYSNQVNRRIEWVIGIGYGEDVEKARFIVQELLKKDSRIHQEPAPLIAVTKLNNSSVDLVIRCWSIKEDYWDVYFSMNEQIYNAFNAANINIPFPQLTVHMANK